MSGNDRTERDIERAERIQKGDHVAFKALFLTYAEPLYAFVEGYTKSPEIAEELVQDLFSKIWEDRARWAPRVSVKSYLYTAARNLSLNYLEHEHVVEALKRDALADTGVQMDPPDEGLQRRHLRQAVRAAVDELPKQCRHVFLLSRQHGLTYREIAAVLEISTKTVESHMRRAFGHLRKLLGPHKPVESSSSTRD